MYNVRCYWCSHFLFAMFDMEQCDIRDTVEFSELCVFLSHRSEYYARALPFLHFQYIYVYVLDAKRFTEFLPNVVVYVVTKSLSHLQLLPLLYSLERGMMAFYGLLLNMRSNRFYVLNLQLTKFTQLPIFLLCIVSQSQSSRFGDSIMFHVFFRRTHTYL